MLYAHDLPEVVDTYNQRKHHTVPPLSVEILAIFVFQDEADNAFFSTMSAGSASSVSTALQMYEEKLNSMIERVFIPYKNRC